MYLPAPYALLARTSGATPAAAEALLAIFTPLCLADTDTFGAARALKRRLTAAGFRDDPDALTVEDMAARRGGSCLSLTLLLGGELLRRGFTPGFVLATNPHDDVHALDEQRLAMLLDEDDGVDADSRLPDATDRASRHRFVAVEHASLRLHDAEGRERPFECTGLGHEWADLDPGWAPPCERVEALTFEQLAATMYVERAKVLLARSNDPATLRAARILAATGVRAFRGNREGWATLFDIACALAAPAAGSGAQSTRAAALAALAARRHAALPADDARWHFTRYRVTGDVRHLDAALARLPTWAEAFYEKHVRRPLDASGSSFDDEQLDKIARRFIVAAWCYAESEILDLRRFYEHRRADTERLFGAAEHRAIMATFDTDPAGSAGSRGPDRAP